ncbi:MAG: site-2 protease family protein [Oscillospiraceae bacterium]|nr:site-2 protease family protein [Oscillospiraceae bacterium]
MDEISNFLTNMDWDGLVTLLLRLAAVLLCIVIHEVSHGLAAYWLGDNTAKERNRLSLNPLKHIDPFGALMMLLVGFGWAKPVPVDMRRFKHPKSGMALTALAGPVSNFILAYVALVVAYFSLGLMVVSGAAAGAAAEGWLSFCSMTASLSLGLGVFNLIPFPPLDGSKVVGVLLPDRIYYKILRYEFAGTIILMALLWLGALDAPLYAARSWLANLLDGLARWPYYLIAG